MHRQFRTYADRIWWLAREAFREHWPRIAGVTALSAFGVAATAAVFLGVVAVARHLEEGGTPVRVLGIELSISPEPGMIMRLVGALALLGGCGAMAIYASEWQIARIAAAFQRRCAQRIALIAADPRYAGWQTLVDDAPRFALLRLTSAARVTAYALRSLLRVILPVMIVVIAVAGLLVVDAALAALLTPLLVVYLVPLYLINRGVARQQRAYKQAAPASKRLLGEGMRLIDSGAPAREKIDWAEHSWDAPEHDRASTLFWQRRLANQRVQALNIIFFTVCLLGLFGLFVVETGRQERAWSDFLVFIIALRFVFFGVRQVTARFVKLSRFLHEYRALSQFLEGAEDIRASNESGTPAALPDVLVFRCGKDGLWSSPPRLRLDKGACAIVLTAHRVTHGMLEAAAARIALSLKEPADLLRRSNLAQDGASVEAMFMDAAGHNRPSSTGPSYGFIVLDDPSAALAIAEQIEREGRGAGLMVLEDRDIIACGDAEWLRANLSAVEDHLSGARESQALADEIDLDDDEEDEE